MLTYAIMFSDEESNLVWPMGSERGILGFIMSTKSKERWGYERVAEVEE